MPLDHYVSQVHLKNFCFDPDRTRLRAIGKSDLKQFDSKTQNVCRVENGSTNAYLTEGRAIEVFLKGVEPNYNASIEKIRQGNIDADCIGVVAGFAAYVAVVSPTAMRIHAKWLQAEVEAVAKITDRQGSFDKVPLVLGGKSLSNLIDNGEIAINIDGKFPQAIGISSIKKFVSIFGNSPWEILHNEQKDSPFFTSDYPAPIELRKDGITNRIVPLAPDLAVRIKPDMRISRGQPDLSFSSFECRDRKLSHDDVVKVNQLIVQCAEDLVFYRDDQYWIPRFVAKHSKYRIEGITKNTAYGSGFLNSVSQRIRHI